MQETQQFWVMAFVLGLILLGLIFALSATIMTASPRKGWMRLMGSLLVGTSFLIDSILDIITKHRLWPYALLFLIGIFLLWLGLRKHKRDPQGKTPPAQIL